VFALRITETMNQKCNSAQRYSKSHEVGNDEERKCRKEKADIMYNMFSNILYLSCLLAITV
jgi:hypothetical protein